MVIIGEGASGVVVSPNVPTDSFKKSSVVYISKLLKKQKLKKD